MQPIRCGRCGRTSKERVMAYGPKGVRLCHANLDGTKSDPDCYHLVTVYGEGRRAPIIDVAQAMWRVYVERNPSWGGEDAWEQQPDYRQDDWRAMADAALTAFAQTPNL